MFKTNSCYWGLCDLHNNFRRAISRVWSYLTQIMFKETAKILYDYGILISYITWDRIIYICLNLLLVKESNFSQTSFPRNWYFNDWHSYYGRVFYSCIYFLIPDVWPLSLEIMKKHLSVICSPLTVLMLFEISTLSIESSVLTIKLRIGRIPLW